MGTFGALLVMKLILLLLSLTMGTMPAFGELMPSFHPSGYQKSTRDMLFLACMYGEDYLIATGSFEDFKEYMEHKVEYIWPKRQNVNFWNRLYYNGLSCARAIAYEDGIEIPDEYQLSVYPEGMDTTPYELDDHYEPL